MLAYKMIRFVFGLLERKESFFMKIIMEVAHSFFVAIRIWMNLTLRD